MKDSGKLFLVLYSLTDITSNRYVWRSEKNPIFMTIAQIVKWGYGMTPVCLVISVHFSSGHHDMFIDIEIF